MRLTVIIAWLQGRGVAPHLPIQNSAKLLYLRGDKRWKRII